MPTYKGDRKSLRQKLALDLDGVGDYLEDPLPAGPVDQVLEHEAGKVGVQALVAGDELVGKGEAGHEAALLEPEDGREAPAEKDALHGGEGDHALRVGGAVRVDPPEGPLGLPPDGRNCLDRVEQVVSFGWVSVKIAVKFSIHQCHINK